ncbi:MAG: (d)CMP kinase [Eubacteriales bacterium]
MSYSIAIDGPAGAGKSTIAKLVAKKKEFIYVDTGAMYRAIAYYFDKHDVNLKNDEAVKKACRDVDITIEYQNGEQVVVLNGENVNGVIRSSEIGMLASSVAANLNVRKKLVELQQELAKGTDIIMDGRDIGTCVLPNANLKIYLTASVEVRAKRRYDELKLKEEFINLRQIEVEIKERDITDMNREHSPLVQANDAIYLDTSSMNIEQVVNRIIAYSIEHDR